MLGDHSGFACDWTPGFATVWNGGLLTALPFVSNSVYYPRCKSHTCTHRWPNPESFIAPSVGPPQVHKSSRNAYPYILQIHDSFAIATVFVHTTAQP